MNNILKIGLVLNYKNAEKKKDELVKINNTDSELLSKDLIITKNGKYIPADVALGLYILKKYQNIQIDFIRPNEISPKRFKMNDIVFILIHDLVESFHLSSPEDFKRYKRTLKCSNNVYPPYEYQKFINNKCTYYKYLEKKKIPVAPTYGITTEKWYSRDPKKYVKKLLLKFKRNKWESVIAKPVYGQESIDFAKFKDIQKNEVIIEKKLRDYFAKVLMKYKGVVIQEFIKGFDRKNPEFRMYYINGKYRFCIITVDDDVKRPVQEGGKYSVPPQNWEYLLSLTKKVMDSLPKINLGGNLMNNILIRIDVGSGLEGVPFSYFINEVEFVPSLYIEDHPYDVIKELANGLVEVSGFFSKKGEVKIKTVF